MYLSTVIELFRFFFLFAFYTHIHVLVKTLFTLAVVNISCLVNVAFCSSGDNGIRLFNKLTKQSINKTIKQPSKKKKKLQLASLGVLKDAGLLLGMGAKREMLH